MRFLEFLVAIAAFAVATFAMCHTIRYDQCHFQYVQYLAVSDLRSQITSERLFGANQSHPDLKNLSRHNRIRRNLATRWKREFDQRQFAFDEQQIKKNQEYFDRMDSAEKSSNPDSFEGAYNKYWDDVEGVVTERTETTSAKVRENCL